MVRLASVIERPAQSVLKPPGSIAVTSAPKRGAAFTDNDQDKATATLSDGEALPIPKRPSGEPGADKAQEVGVTLNGCGIEPAGTDVSSKAQSPRAPGSASGTAPIIVTKDANGAARSEESKPP